MKYISLQKLRPFLLVVCFVLMSHSAFSLDLTPDEMQEVVKISKNVGLAKPSLPDSKKLEYAVGIFKASKKFGIQPNLLIAIAAQETSFREDLPEGKAGEFGIVQIRKIWVKNPKLRRYFKTIKLKDLNVPEKAFSFAAWILNDLRRSSPKSSIPFWSFYNARSFEPRFKYFLAVNQKLSYLNRGIPFTREIEDNIQINGSADQKSWQPDIRVLAAATKENIPTQDVAKNEIIQKDNASTTLITAASLSSDVEFKPQGWIAQAIKRLQDEPVKVKHSNLTIPISQLKTNIKSKEKERLALSKTAKILLNSIQD